MTTSTPAPTMTTPYPGAAAQHFAAKLRHETDVSDVHAALETVRDSFVLVDSRNAASWESGHLPGALHLPGREIGERALDLITLDVPVVVYCWGPGCNGATKAALALAELGYEVKEMIGGYEYWVREGLPVLVDGRLERQPADRLTSPVAHPDCGCH